MQSTLSFLNFSHLIRSFSHLIRPDKHDKRKENDNVIEESSHQENEDEIDTCEDGRMILTFFIEEGFVT